MVVPQKIKHRLSNDIKFPLPGIHQKDENKDTDTYIHMFTEA